ncbi:MAG: FitA-like ribbon-helix-helix domain-containing protein [Gemmataceae bacterium]
MPTLIVEDLPGEIYERLQRRAKAENRTLEAEVVRVLEKGLNGPESQGDVSVPAPKVASPRLPDPPILDTGEMSAPFDLPRSGVGVRVPTRPGGVRLPDPLVLPEEEENRV